jgi:hypothetical protein
MARLWCCGSRLNAHQLAGGLVRFMCVDLRLAGLRHQDQKDRKRYQCDACEGEKGRAVACRHHDRAGDPIADRGADTLNGCDRAETHIVATGAAHEVGHDERREDAEYSSTDAVKKLHRDQPSAIIRECVKHAANRQDSECREKDRLAATAVSSPLCASASFCPTRASIGAFAKWKSATHTAKTSKGLQVINTLQPDGCSPLLGWL